MIVWLSAIAQAQDEQAFITIADRVAITSSADWINSDSSHGVGRVTVQSETEDRLQITTQQSGVALTLFVPTDSVASVVGERTQVHSSPGQPTQIQLKPGVVPQWTTLNHQWLGFIIDEAGVRVTGWLPQTALAPTFVDEPNEWPTDSMVDGPIALRAQPDGHIIATLMGGEHPAQVLSQSTGWTEVRVHTPSMVVEGWVPQSQVRATDPSTRGFGAGAGGTIGSHSLHQEWMSLSDGTAIVVEPQGPSFAVATAESRVIRSPLPPRGDWFAVEVAPPWGALPGWVKCQQRIQDGAGFRCR